MSRQWARPIRVRLVWWVLVCLVAAGSGPVLGDDDDPGEVGFPEATPEKIDEEMKEDAEKPEPLSDPAEKHGLPAGALGPGDKVLPLSLLDAVKMGMEANLALRAGSYDSPLAQQAVIAADASFDDLLSATLEGGHVERPQNFIFQGIAVQRDNVLNTSAGLSRRTRTGGSLALLYRMDRIDTNSPVVFRNPAYENTLNLEVMQPLLRGAGDIALSDLRRAQNGVVAARANYDTQIEQVLLNIVSAYWELAFAYDNLAARESSFKVAGEVLVEAQARLEAEKGTPLDVAEARAGLERRRSEVLTADNLLGSVSDQLLSLIVPFGPERLGGVIVKPTNTLSDEPLPAPTLAEVKRLVGDAVTGRPEVRAARADIANRGLDMVQAADAVRPQLDLYGRLGTATLRGDIERSIGDMIAGPAFSATVGVQFSMFIGQRAARANWRAAGWARRQAMLRFGEIENQIVVQVRAAARDMRTAEAQVTAGTAEVRAATEDLQGERDKLLEGVSTPFRVLQKEDDLTGARTRLARAAADIRLARADLWRSAGVLTRNLGVEAPGWPSCRTCK